MPNLAKPSSLCIYINLYYLPSLIKWCYVAKWFYVGKWFYVTKWFMWPSGFMWLKVAKNAEKWGEGGGKGGEKVEEKW